MTIYYMSLEFLMGRTLGNSLVNMGLLDETSNALQVSSPMNCDEAVERKLQYTRQWVQSVPPDVVGTIRSILSIA